MTAMMTTIRSTALLLALLLSGNAVTLADALGGIGVLGDSYSDEYEFYPPHRSTARNWVEILATTRGLDFGRFDADGRAEPRNQGHAFNWARSGATTEDLIRTGQHTGLAAQVARGEVGLVVIFIGGNDFINALKDPDPAAALGAALPRALANHRTAVRTILEASQRVRLVLVTVPDIRHLPEFDGLLRAGRLSKALADEFTAAIGRYNAQIRSLAASDPRIALMDLDTITRAVNFLSRDYVLVAGRRLDRHRPANELDCFFLADGRHPGTLGQGLFACMFIEVVNTKFAAGIKPLKLREVLIITRSVVPPRDAEIGMARFAGAPQPASPVKPVADHTEQARTDVVGR
jgi:phospholipase/lecithinase/hemolysin